MKSERSVNVMLRLKPDFLKGVKEAAEALDMKYADFYREALEILAKVPKEDLVKLHSLSQEAGLSLSAIIREAIQPYVMADNPQAKAKAEAGTVPPILALLRQRTARTHKSK